MDDLAALVSEGARIKVKVPPCGGATTLAGALAERRPAGECLWWSQEAHGEHRGLLAWRWSRQLGCLRVGDSLQERLSRLAGALSSADGAWLLLDGLSVDALKWLTSWLPDEPSVVWFTDAEGRPGSYRRVAPPRLRLPHSLKLFRLWTGRPVPQNTAVDVVQRLVPHWSMLRIAGLAVRATSDVEALHPRQVDAWMVELIGEPREPARAFVAAFQSLEALPRQVLLASAVFANRIVRLHDLAGVLSRGHDEVEEATELLVGRGLMIPGPHRSQVMVPSLVHGWACSLAGPLGELRGLARAHSDWFGLLSAQGTEKGEQAALMPWIAELELALERAVDAEDAPLMLDASSALVGADGEGLWQVLGLMQQRRATIRALQVAARELQDPRGALLDRAVDAGVSTGAGRPVVLPPELVHELDAAMMELSTLHAQLQVWIRHSTTDLRNLGQPDTAMKALAHQAEKLLNQLEGEVRASRSGRSTQGPEALVARVQRGVGRLRAWCDQAERGWISIQRRMAQRSAQAEQFQDALALLEAQAHEVEARLGGARDAVDGAWAQVGDVPDAREGLAGLAARVEELAGRLKEDIRKLAAMKVRPEPALELVEPFEGRLATYGAAVDLVHKELARTLGHAGRVRDARRRAAAFGTLCVEAREHASRLLRQVGAIEKARRRGVSLLEEEAEHLAHLRALCGRIPEAEVPDVDEAAFEALGELVETLSTSGPGLTRLEREVGRRLRGLGVSATEALASVDEADGSRQIETEAPAGSAPEEAPEEAPAASDIPEAASRQVRPHRPASGAAGSMAKPGGTTRREALITAFDLDDEPEDEEVTSVAPSVEASHAGSSTEASSPASREPEVLPELPVENIEPIEQTGSGDERLVVLRKQAASLHQAWSELQRRAEPLAQADLEQLPHARSLRDRSLAQLSELGRLGEDISQLMVQCSNLCLGDILEDRLAALEQLVSRQREGLQAAEQLLDAAETSRVRAESVIEQRLAARAEIDELQAQAAARTTAVLRLAEPLAEEEGHDAFEVRNHQAQLRAALEIARRSHGELRELSHELEDAGARQMVRGARRARLLGFENEDACRASQELVAALRTHLLDESSRRQREAMSQLEEIKGQAVQLRRPVERLLIPVVPELPVDASSDADAVLQALQDCIDTLHDAMARVESHYERLWSTDDHDTAQQLLMDLLLSSGEAQELADKAWGLHADLNAFIEHLVSRREAPIRERVRHALAVALSSPIWDLLESVLEQEMVYLAWKDDAVADAYEHVAELRRGLIEWGDEAHRYDEILSELAIDHGERNLASQAEALVSQWDARVSAIKAAVSTLDDSIDKVRLDRQNRLDQLAAKARRSLDRLRSGWLQQMGSESDTHTVRQAFADADALVKQLDELTAQVEAADDPVVFRQLLDTVRWVHTEVEELDERMGQARREARRHAEDRRQAVLQEARESQRRLVEAHRQVISMQADLSRVADDDDMYTTARACIRDLQAWRQGADDVLQRWTGLPRGNDGEDDDPVEGPKRIEQWREDATRLVMSHRGLLGRGKELSALISEQLFTELVGCAVEVQQIARRVLRSMSDVREQLHTDIERLRGLSPSPDVDVLLAEGMERLERLRVIRSKVEQAQVRVSVASHVSEARQGLYAAEEAAQELRGEMAGLEALLSRMARVDGDDTDGPVDALDEVRALQSDLKVAHGIWSDCTLDEVHDVMAAVEGLIGPLMDELAEADGSTAASAHHGVAADVQLRAREARRRLAELEAHRDAIFDQELASLVSLAEGQAQRVDDAVLEVTALHQQTTLDVHQAQQADHARAYVRQAHHLRDEVGRASDLGTARALLGDLERVGQQAEGLLHSVRQEARPHDSADHRHRQVKADHASVVARFRQHHEEFRALAEELEVLAGSGWLEGLVREEEALFLRAHELMALPSPTQGQTRVLQDRCDELATLLHRLADGEHSHRAELSLWEASLTVRQLLAELGSWLDGAIRQQQGAETDSQSGRRAELVLLCRRWMDEVRVELADMGLLASDEREAWLEEVRGRHDDLRAQLMALVQARPTSLPEGPDLVKIRARCDALETPLAELGGWARKAHGPRSLEALRVQDALEALAEARQALLQAEGAEGHARRIACGRAQVAVEHAELQLERGVDVREGRGLQPVSPADIPTEEAMPELPPEP